MKNSLIKLSKQLQKIFFANIGCILALFLLNFTTTAWQMYNIGKSEIILAYGFSLFFASFFIVAFLEFINNSVFKIMAKISLLILVVWLVVKGFDLLLAGIGILLTIQMIYSLKVKRIIISSLLAVCGLSFTLEVFSIYTYKTWLGAGIITALIETNVNEAVEFFHVYIGIREIIFAIALGGIIYVFHKYIDVMREQIIRHKKIIHVTLLIGLFNMGYMLAYQSYLFSNNQYSLIQRAVVSAGFSIGNILIYDDIAAQINDTTIITENNSKIKNIVFILGESTNRNYLGVYGYDLATTPQFERLQSSDNGYLFTDVISPHSVTVSVLRKLLTFCNYEAEKEWYEYNNLINIMNDSGYKTFWLSNQEKSGIWGNISQVFAERSAESAFTSIRDSHEEYGIYDEELLPMIEQALEDRAEKNFFVIHLMGTHNSYENRYPEAFKQFNKEDITKVEADNKKIVVANYANAVLYNDYIVSEVINKFSNDETIVIYVSDHGESIYDAGDLVGHAEAILHQSMFEIPMLLWVSDKFKDRYPQLVERIAKSTDRPYMTDDMIHTILDITDIKTPEYEPARSIVNAQFDSTRKRIVRNTHLAECEQTDYDVDLKAIAE